MKQKILVVYLFLLFCFLNRSSAQMEYLVTINKESGALQVAAILPDVQYVTVLPDYACFDENHKRYTFLGIGYNKKSIIYTVDAISGRMIAQIPFLPEQNKDINLMEFEYASATDKLCSMMWDSKKLLFSFINIDPFTGNIDVLNTLPGLRGVWAKNTCFDQEKCRYIFKGDDDAGNSFLYTLSAKDGSILSKVPVENMGRNILTEIQYSELLKKPCALYRDTSLQWHFATIDLLTGKIEKICSLPFAILDFSLTATVDNCNNQYIFCGKTDTSSSLFALDIVSGQVHTKPAFPLFDTVGDNVILMQCDNKNNGKLYALHWSYKIKKDQQYKFYGGPVINVYPNPFRNNCSISCDRRCDEIKVVLHSATGQKIREQSATNTTTLSFSGQGIASGQYYFDIYINKGFLRTEKVIIQ